MEIDSPTTEANSPSAATLVADASWPRIALITPVFNSGKYIEATIRSVLGQEYPNLDYYIVDAGSTDGTLDVIRKYEGQISGWMSEPDRGMYDALNKGFARTSGEVMGWISATDMLHSGALRLVGSIFRDIKEADWITGRPTLFSEDGMTVSVGEVPHWSRMRFLMGANRYIQQESTFWRRRLWEKAGGRTDDSQRYASDFELWVRFFRHARLYPVDAIIGGFRVHDDSLGLQAMEICHRIHDAAIEKELERESWGKHVRRFRQFSARVAKIPKIRGIWRWLVMESLYHRKARDWAPVIRWEWDRWTLQR
jgi:glycosyltransferase involved in cell wall biosynthesis